MKITSSDVALASSHEAWRAQETNTRMRVWADSNAGGRTAPGFGLEFNQHSRVEFSEAARAQLAFSQRNERVPQRSAAPQGQVADTEASSGTDEAQRGGGLPARLQLLKDIVEALTGREVRFVTPGQLQGSDTSSTSDTAPANPTTQTGSTQSGASEAPQRAGWGLEFDSREVREEYERTSFSASGSATTADGQKINFSLNLSMERYERQETSVSVRAGDALLKDPLVLSLDGNAVSTTGDTIRFDLSGQGSTDKLPVLRGAAYLALDKNGNGRIDNGTELFGPQSGDGYADLAKLDSDGNGWIDESDPAFANLKLWRPTSDGAGTLTSIASAGVGALYLGHVDTPFTLKDGQNADLGAVRASGIYLKESGEVGAMQQIDVAV
ncbi:hypothetical protein [Niveibacterium microcysteis]|uniref:VCBS repeat-containing protein n=1 Tax=Niveibacterium microcysteis TaxID=2811415 RepID=A0ABX7M0V8_9RHOO|nr:hypothetical protein [Niveibacterium microcysteis]QSI75396.1 hypothetical protein JY500_12840 [Niveibacterium microcysteis]